MQKFILLVTSLFLATQVSAQSFTNYTTADGLVNNVVNCVTVDSEDNIWFGTNKGISKFDGIDTWETFTVADGTGLVDDVITAIYVTEEGVLWVGTDFGISQWDGSSFTTYTDARDIGNTRIQCITEGNYGDLYFGTAGGYAHYRSNGTWNNFSLAEGIPFGGIKDLRIDKNDKIWLALGLEGLGIYDTNSIFIAIDGILLNQSATGVHLDSDTDEIWISSGGGVDQLGNLDAVLPSVIHHDDIFELPPPHTLNQVVDVQQDSKGRIWAGIFIDYLVNVGGISYLEDGVWTSLDMDDGLIGPVVKELAIDSKDNVWVATSSGVSKYGSLALSVKDYTTGGDEGMQLFPNPASDYVTLALAGPTTKKTKVDIYNSSLQLIQTALLAAGESSVTIDLQAQTAGLYFVKRQDQVISLVKQK